MSLHNEHNYSAYKFLTMGYIITTFYFTARKLLGRNLQVKSVANKYEKLTVQILSKLVISKFSINKFSR